MVDIDDVVHNDDVSSSSNVIFVFPFPKDFVVRPQQSVQLARLPHWYFPRLESVALGSELFLLSFDLLLSMIGFDCDHPSLYRNTDFDQLHPLVTHFVV